MEFTWTGTLRVRSWKALAGVLTLGMAAVAVNAAPATLKYRIENLDMPDYSNVRVVGLNNKGAVAINAWSGFNEVNPSIYSKGVFTSVADRFRFLQGINDRGDLIGEGLDLQYTWLWRGGQMIDLRTTFSSMALTGVAVAINNRGQVTGSMQTDYHLPAQVFVYDGRSSRYLEMPENNGAVGWDINGQGSVAGQFEPPEYFDGEYLGFVHDGTRATVLPTLGGKQGYAYGINDAGQVVGYAFTEGDAGIGAYLYDNGTVTPLGFGIAQDINNHGWIVGGGNRGGPGEAVLWRDGTLQYLNDLLVARDAGSWSLSFASAINDRGQIIGEGMFDGERRPFLATPVPEPSAWALMLAGVGVIGWVAGHLRTRTALPRSGSAAG